MKNLRNLFFLFTLFTMLSCQNDDEIIAEPEAIPFTMQFDYNGETIVLEDVLMNDIRNVTTNTIVGRCVQGGLMDPDNKYIEKYHLNLLFYKNGDDYQLFSINFMLPVYDSNSSIGYYKSGYNNNFTNPTELPFSHNITYQNGKLTGEFSCKITDGGNYSDGSLSTITIENGKLDFTVPY